MARDHRDQSLLLLLRWSQEPAELPRLRGAQVHGVQVPLELRPPVSYQPPAASLFNSSSLIAEKSRLAGLAVLESVSAPITCSASTP